ncbi:DUF4920 domain-containing protein [Terrimonas ferruginea]|uniref:DUF4920 domain-containing protein n=1 Tax=Terrimonas ferruginea TaxID=249 RepID=UPI0003F550C4|nr:DUF4920 domain-containing protein [Terrimonas ferruginea]
MKRIVLAAALFSTAAIAQPPAGDAKPGDSYGEKVNPAGAIAIAEIPAKLANTESIDTKIKAKVLDVCPKKGCWVSLAINDSTTAFVKMKDYAFFTPLALKGKTVVLDGKAFVKTTSVSELRHYAEDAKKSPEEIAAITEPKKEIRFLANGITVVE